MPANLPTPPRRVLVIGSTASGKSIVAAALSQRWNLPNVEMDRLHWSPNWTKRPEFATEMGEWIARDTWIIDGSYTAIVTQAWPRAEQVIWLDLPFRQLVTQQFWRSLRRIVTKEDVCNGNRETFRNYFFSRDSLIWWLVKTYRPRRVAYSALAAQNHAVPLVRLPDRRAIDRWLRELA